MQQSQINRQGVAVAWQLVDFGACVHVMARSLDRDQNR
jgi:uncharacterized membrane protein